MTSRRELDALTADSAAIYRTAVAALVGAGLPFLVGGAYALRRYTGIFRWTKDFDVFVRPADVGQVLEVLRSAGFTTELPFPHWLGKAYKGDDFVDVIFSSGNGLSVVDDAWFERSMPGEVLGLWLPVCPAEEMIWSKAFVLERERNDNADVAHLLRALAEDLDWDRLLRRFGAHWRVLLAHLALFGFIYPSDRARIPSWVMEELNARLGREIVAEPPERRICLGTLLSREQYLVDVEELGYEDGRLAGGSQMTGDEIDIWTEAIPRRRAVYDHGGHGDHGNHGQQGGGLGGADDRGRR